MEQPNSLSFAVKIDKKQSRRLRRLFYPLTRPAQVPPKKKVARRLIKKWFNRCEKESYIGREIIITSKAGEEYRGKITDAKIIKDGGHRRNYDFKITPIK